MRMPVRGLVVAAGAVMGLALVPALCEVKAAAARLSCSCPQARRTMGWCEAHEVGYVAGVRIRSELLFETLDAHGHTVDPATFTCPSCRRAIASSGFCEEHRIGFVAGEAYFSRLTYETAVNEKADPAGVACRACRKNAKGLGWCDACGVGRVGWVVVRDRERFERLARDVAILEAATRIADRCERCAEAMVTNAECALCRITYKDGRPVKGAGGSSPQP